MAGSASPWVHSPAPAKGPRVMRSHDTSPINVVCTSQPAPAHAACQACKLDSSCAAKPPIQAVPPPGAARVGSAAPRRRPAAACADRQPLRWRNTAGRAAESGRPAERRRARHRADSATVPGGRRPSPAHRCRLPPAAAANSPRGPAPAPHGRPRATGQSPARRATPRAATSPGHPVAAIGRSPVGAVAGGMRCCLSTPSDRSPVRWLIRSEARKQWILPRSVLTISCPSATASPQARPCNEPFQSGWPLSAL